MRNTGKTQSSAVRTMLVVGAMLVLAFDPAAAQETQGAQVESSIGAVLTNVYFFRGILQEKEGAIVQPWVDFVFPLGEGENTSWSLNTGIWNSLHDGPTGAGTAGMTMHYELDVYVGIGVDFARNWTGSVSYVVLSSPNSAFATVQELDFSISFDDSHVYGGESSGFSGFQPAVMLAWELHGQSDGSRGGGDEGIYLQLGIEPAFNLFDDSNHPVSTSFPVVAGFGFSDYYEDTTGSDDFLGFVQGGVSLSTPLNFIPARMGSWAVSGGVAILFLGDNLEAINGGDNSEVIVSIGLGITF